MNQEKDFSIGDVVRLRSGGPDMTVQKKVTTTPFGEPCDLTYRCQWFVGEKLESGKFPPNSLTPA